MTRSPWRSRLKYVGSSPGKNWSWKQSLPCHWPTRQRRVRVAGVRAVVVAAGDEVVAAVPAEPVEQLTGLAQVDGTASAVMSPAASRNDAPSASASSTSDSSMTSGYGGRPGTCWMPDDLRHAADEPGRRLAHVQVVAQRDGEEEAARRRLRAW